MKKVSKAMYGKSMMKTGGMVNANTKVSADKTPGSKGVKSGTNPKASASKVAKGKVGGTSKAPKTAVPKAQYGGVKNK
jgi:hypothetical protein